MTSAKTRKLVWAALFTAMTTVATMVVAVPSPTGGYLNAGDALVILSAFLLGPVWGAIAAGLGSALADIFAGYFVYAPATLIIKALMALVAGAILRHAKESKRPVLCATTAAISAELIMVAGYFAFTATFLGLGMGALAGIPGNLCQAAFGIAGGLALFFALQKIPYVKSNF